MKMFSLVLSASILTLFTSGCYSVIGKNVETEINPDFKLNEYNKFDLHSHEESSFLGDILLRFFEKQGFSMANTYPTKYDLYVYATMEKGFCLPPQFNPYKMWFQFTFPKKAEISIQDAVTKKVLLTCKYKRGLWATSAGYVEFEEMIMESLTKAFDDLKKKENTTDTMKQDIKNKKD